MGQQAVNLAELRAGLRKLKGGSIILVIASVLMAVGAVSFTASAVFFMGTFMALGPAAIALLVPLIIVEVIGVILGLIGIYAYVVPAYGRFRLFNEDLFGTSATLVRLGLLGGLIATLIAVILLFLAIAAGLSGVVGAALTLTIVAVGLLVLAAILLIIGKVGLAIGSFKLKDVANESLFTVVGVFFIISLSLDIVSAVFKPALIISSAVSFIAWILSYVACGSALRRLGPAPPPAAQ